MPEAAKMLGLSDPKTIYGLIHTGQLKARKVGRIYLVNFRSLKALVGE
ncbi:helix-turn-helix domain-containing protein [Bifidobacterium pullorum]